MLSKGAMDEGMMDGWMDGGWLDLGSMGWMMCGQTWIVA